MTTQVVLTAKLDTGAAKALRDQLLQAKDDNILLDGKNVEYLGSLCLELLMSAKHLWNKAGRKFVLENPSAELRDDLVRFGLSPETFARGAA